MLCPSKSTEHTSAMKLVIKRYIYIFFFLFLHKKKKQKQNRCCDLCEVILMSTHNICCHVAIPLSNHNNYMFWSKKIYPKQKIANSQCIYYAPCYVTDGQMDIRKLTKLGFKDTSTLVGHFVSLPREREKRDRRDSRGDEREGQGRKENEWKWRNRRNKNIPPLPLPAAKTAGQ